MKGEQDIDDRSSVESFYVATTSLFLNYRLQAFQLFFPFFFLDLWHVHSQFKAMVECINGPH